MKKKLEEKKIFLYNGKIDFQLCNDYFKTFPISLWGKSIIRMFIFFIVLIILGVLSQAYVLYIVIVQTIFVALVCIFNILRKEKIIQKECNEYLKQIKDKEYTLEFYEDYFIRTSEYMTIKYDYTDIKKIIESNNYIYLSSDKLSLCLKKELIDEEQINFIRNLNKDIYYKKGKTNLKPKTVNKILNSIFILSILCIVFIVQNIQDSQSRYLLTKNLWQYWILLIFPLLSLILGIKYKNKGKEYDCKMNIIGGSITLVIMLFLCIFISIPQVEEDYKNIYKYENIISIDLPQTGNFEENEPFSFYYNQCLKDLREYEIKFKNKDSEKVENDIKNNKNWISYTELKSSLNIFLVADIYDKNNNYYLIYNSTLDEYNSLPEKSGEYEYYVMEFDTYKKILKIYEYKYSYRN